MPLEGGLPFVLFWPDLLEFELTLTKAKGKEIFYVKSCKNSLIMALRKYALLLPPCETTVRKPFIASVPALG